MLKSVAQGHMESGSFLWALYSPAGIIFLHTQAASSWRAATKVCKPLCTSQGLQSEKCSGHRGIVSDCGHLQGTECAPNSVSLFLNPVPTLVEMPRGANEINFLSQLSESITGPTQFFHDVPKGSKEEICIL